MRKSRKQKSEKTEKKSEFNATSISTVCKRFCSVALDPCLAQLPGVHTVRDGALCMLWHILLLLLRLLYTGCLEPGELVRSSLRTSLSLDFLATPQSSWDPPKSPDSLDSIPHELCCNTWNEVPAGVWAARNQPPQRTLFKHMSMEF